MNGMTQYLGRGLLVLALCGWAVGCGDDDDSGGGDSGVDSGAGGSGGTGGGGTGGSKDAGGGTGGSTDGGGGAITKQECIDMTNATSSHASDACISCACEKDAKVTAACDSKCWALIECVATKCGGDAMQADCFTADKCLTEVTAPGVDTMAATATGDVLTMMCGEQCVVPSGTDGGAEDAGN